MLIRLSYYQLCFGVWHATVLIIPTRKMKVISFLWCISRFEDYEFQIQKLQKIDCLSFNSFQLYVRKGQLTGNNLNRAWFFYWTKYYSKTLAMCASSKRQVFIWKKKKRETELENTGTSLDVRQHFKYSSTYSSNKQLNKSHMLLDKYSIVFFYCNFQR